MKLYREVFDRQCSQLAHESKLARSIAERLQREISEKDDVTTRLHGDLLAANQARQRLEQQCSQMRSQLDSELDSKEQLQFRYVFRHQLDEILYRK